MRNWLVIFLLLFSCSSGQPKASDCQKFKNGKFKMVYEGHSETIDRNGDLQTEIVEGSKDTLTFKIKWVDDCSYVLIYSDKDLKKFPQIPKDAAVTVQITEAKKNSYMQTSTANFSDKVVTAEVVKIN